MSPSLSVGRENRVGELLINFQDVAFLLSKDNFSTTFLKSLVEVKALGPSHVLKLWLGVIKGMLLVKYIRSNKDCFLCQLNFIEIIRLSQN